MPEGWTSARSIDTRVKVARLLLCLVLAISAGMVAYHTAATIDYHRDFAQVWYASRVFLHGENPYAAIGPGRIFDWPWPLYYPLPAAIAAIPLAPFRETVAMGLFAALGAGAFAWALTDHGLAPLLAFLSVSFWHANTLAQWSPLLAGAYAIGPLSAILIAKPTIGAAVFVAQPRWWTVLGAFTLLGIAFVAQPHWLSAWTDALWGGHELRERKFPSLPPVALRGGAVALIALLRWRRPEARLIAALACVPQTLVPAEGLLLFLVPRGRAQSALFLLCNYIMGWWLTRLPLPHDVPDRLVFIGRSMVVTMYLPATVMVLLRRNEGPAPAWLERRIDRWPAFLRGHANAAPPA